jgi:hypothetical protein
MCEKEKNRGYGRVRCRFSHHFLFPSIAHRASFFQKLSASYLFEYRVSINLHLTRRKSFQLAARSYFQLCDSIDISAAKQ